MIISVLFIIGFAFIGYCAAMLILGILSLLSDLFNLFF